jgi:integrase/recombinase XerD
MHRNVYGDIIELREALGITKRVHPHLTRHTFAYHFMKNGGSIYTLSRILGHSSVSTTQTYIRVWVWRIFGKNMHVFPLWRDGKGGMFI